MWLAGWFGRVKAGDDKTKPVEVVEDMHWNDAAVDVSEFGVHRVSISKKDLEPYDAERLHAEGMVFDPSESRTEALAEAEKHFIHRGRRKKKPRRNSLRNFTCCGPNSRWFTIPCGWRVTNNVAQKIGCDMIQRQPAFESVPQPAEVRLTPVTLTTGDALKMLEFIVLAIEARRPDWLKRLDFHLEVDEPVLWALPANEVPGT